MTSSADGQVETPGSTGVMVQLCSKLLHQLRWWGLQELSQTQEATGGWWWRLGRGALQVVQETPPVSPPQGNLEVTGQDQLIRCGGGGGAGARC